MEYHRTKEDLVESLHRALVPLRRIKRPTISLSTHKVYLEKLKFVSYNYFFISATTTKIKRKN